MILGALSSHVIKSLVEPGFTPLLDPSRTPIRGATPTINVVLAYASAPDHKLTQETRELFYGATGV